MSSYHHDKVCSICLYVDSQCDLDLWLIDFKINRDHLHPETHVCAKFEEPRSILCLVIIRTRFGFYVNMLTVNVTLAFDQLTSKSIGIIYTPRRRSVPNSRSLGQFCVQLSFGQDKIYWRTDGQTFAKQYTPTSLKGGIITDNTQIIRFTFINMYASIHNNAEVNSTDQ